MADKKSLFENTPKCAYTPTACALDTEIREAILPVLLKYVNLGYSAREVSHVAHGALSEQECNIVLGFYKEGDNGDKG